MAFPWPQGPADLPGSPDASGMSDPLPGVNPSVDPDGWTIRASSAELGGKTREV